MGILISWQEVLVWPTAIKLNTSFFLRHIDTVESDENFVLWKW